MGAAAGVIGKAVVGFFASKAIAVVIVRTILINIALGALQKKLSRRKDAPPPLNVTVRGTVEHRRIVLGTRRCGGVIVFYGTSGGNLKLLWYVVVMTGHQVSAITDIWIDNRRIAAADIDGSGNVTAGDFSGKVLIKRHLGSGAQTADTDLEPNFTAWTTNHRLRGCAYIIVRMERDDVIFPYGAPQGVGALINGALLYDPRQDSTNGGSGSHRRDDPSTWGFTGIGRNPALQTRWFLSGGSVVNDQATRMIMYGLREIDSRIIDSYTIAAANVCDEVLSGSVAPPSGDQPRYRCDIEISCGEIRRDIIEAILATMAGTAVNEKGQWRIHAGAYDTPVHALTQADLYGELEIEDTDGPDARYNAVGAKFIDAAKQYVEQTTIFRTDSAYESQDGGERIPRIIDLRAVTDQYQAQRLAEIELRKSRMMRKARLVGALNLLKIAKHETLNYSHARYGWSSRIFRCEARQFEFNEEAGRVVITTKREDPAVYADMLTADYQTGTSFTDTFTLDGPDAPTDLTIERFREQLLLSWTMPTFRGQTLYTEVFEHTAATPFSSAVKVTETAGNAVVIKQFSSGPRFYWIRRRNGAGQVSATFPTTNGQQAQALDALEEVAFDSFEHQDAPRFYDIVGTPTITYPTNGENGGRVLRVQNRAELYLKKNTPYNPSKLHVFEAYARLVQAPSNPAHDRIYIGLRGIDADGSTTIFFNSSHHFGVANDFDMGTLTLGSWRLFRGYFSGLSGSPSPSPAPNMSDPMELMTGVRFVRPVLILNYDGGDGIMEVDWWNLGIVTDQSGIAPDSASDDAVTSSPTDGSIFYDVATQPAIENAGLNGSAAYTVALGEPPAKVVVGCTAQARISNTTSGTAVGEARLQLIVQINGATVYARYLALEGYAAGTQYAVLADSHAFEVPAGQQIQAFLNVGRNFSSGGASPSQTIFWRAASLALTPLKR